MLLLRLPESPRWLISKGRLKEAEAIIRQIEASTEKRSPVAVTPLTAAAQKKSNWKELFSPVYLKRTLIVWIIWATTYGITNGMNNWMSTIYTSVYGLPLQEALNRGFLTNAMQVLVLILCIFVIDIVGRRAWMTACFVIGGLLLLPLGIFGAGDANTFMIFATLSYGIMSTINTVLYLYTPEIYPTRMRAIGTAAGTALAAHRIRCRTDGGRVHDGIGRNPAGVPVVRRCRADRRAGRDADDRDAQSQARRDRAVAGIPG